MWVKEISASDTYELRHQILRAGFPRNSIHFLEDRLEGSFHLGVFQDSELISIGSFYKNLFPNDAIMKIILSEKITTYSYQQLFPYQLRGMATSEKFRKKGAGNLILKTANFIILNDGANLFWCNARLTAVPFYKSLGFKAMGMPFKSNTLSHITMVKYLL